MTLSASEERMASSKLTPDYHALDYEALLHEAQQECATSMAAFLRHRLPSKWHKMYVEACSRPTNIVRVQCGRFEYLLDVYSELEVIGEIPYDQTVEDRVVAVLGMSAGLDELRVVARMRGWLGESGELVAASRDRGHFIAQCIGGGHDLNVFSQDRKLNRGWSPEGKVYRQMERYCQEHPGTFCFSRPVYGDSSSVPRWLEFGVLKEDKTLWVEVFDNLPE